MEIGDYLQVVRRRWRPILLILLLSIGGAALFTVLAEPRYRSDVTFFVSTAGDDTSSAYTGGLFSEQRVQSYSNLVTGPTTASEIAKVVPGLKASDLADGITASAVPDTVLLTVSATADSAARALAVAQGIATVFPGVVTALETPTDGGTSPVKVSVAEQPRLASSPFSPRPLRNLGLAAVLGLLLGVGLAVLRDALDNTVKDADGALAATGAATVGFIAYDPGASRRPLIVQDDPRSPRAESFRQLRTNLQFVGVDGPLRSLVITSSVPQEGKSTTACNLAITLAQAGVRVCLVEGDLRRPRLADYLGLEGAVGVTTVLIGQAGVEDALQPWGDGTLEVLASGPIPPNPSELLSSQGMVALLKALEARFEVVIVDAPPLLPVTDGAILATLTGGALLAARAGHTRREQLAQAAAALTAVEAKILGVVLNMLPAKGPDAYHAYGYGYGSYDSDANKPQLAMADALRAVERPGLPAARHRAPGRQDSPDPGTPRANTPTGSQPVR